MKRIMMLTAATLSIGWAADVSPQPSSTPPMQNNMRQMPMFAEFDIDKDGKVSQSEFDEVRAQRMNTRAEDGRMLKNAGNAPTFSEIDSDKDGYLSVEEFRAHRMSQRGMMGKNMGMGQKNADPQKMENYLRNSFDRMDKDNNGQVTFDEYRDFRMQQATNCKTGMRCSGMWMGQKRMRQMPAFTDYDLNNDGEVTQKEFDEARAKRMQQRAEEGKMMRNAPNAPTFESIDTNNDGNISPDEFKAHQTQQMNNPKKGMMQGQGMKCGGKQQ